MQHLRELEEEMLVNLMRSKFILAIDISQVQGEFDPANPGPDVRIPYIKKPERRHLSAAVFRYW